MDKSQLPVTNQAPAATSRDAAAPTPASDQDTLGNEFIASQTPTSEGADAPSTPPAQTSPSGAPPVCDGPDDDALALRIAADLMGGGSWWSSQPTPACYATPILRLRRCVGPAAAPENDDVQGAAALEEMDQAQRELAPAFATVDPTWASTWYEPAAAKLRQRLMTEAAMDSVEAADTGVSPTDPGAAIAAIDDTIDSLDRLADFVTVKSLKWARKTTDTIVKAEELSVQLPNPKTGALEEVVSHTRLREWLGFAKVFLMAANSGGKLDDAFGTPLQIEDADDFFRELAGRTSVVLEGVAGVVGVTATLGYGALVLASKEYPQIATSCLQHAEVCKKLSMRIASHKGLSGVLAALSIVKTPPSWSTRTPTSSSASTRQSESVVEWPSWARR